MFGLLKAWYMQLVTCHTYILSFILFYFIKFLFGFKNSLFETIALGLAKDRTSAIVMATSIGMHQPAESIALVVSFLKSTFTKKQIFNLLTVFSSVGLFGVYFGYLLSQVTSSYMEALILSITSGTFLYVGAVEVIDIMHASMYICVYISIYLSMDP